MPAALIALLSSGPFRTALFCVLCGVGGYLWGYARGSGDEAREGDIRAHAAQTKFQLAARRAEEVARAEQGRIAREYEEQLREVRHEQETLQNRLADYELADAVRLPSVPAEPDRVQCPAVAAPVAGRVPGGAKARSGAICYTEAQLRRKVAESVAIGQECDREMIRFQKLIEACSAR